MLNRCLWAVGCAFAAGMIAAGSAGARSIEFGSGAVWQLIDGPMASAVRLASKAPTSSADIGEIFVMLEEGTQPEDIDLKELHETIKRAIEEAQRVCEASGGTDCPDMNHSWSYAVVGATAEDAGNDGRFPEDRQIMMGDVRQVPKPKKFSEIAKNKKPAGHCPAGWSICDGSNRADEPADEFNYLMTVISPRRIATDLAAELRALARE